MPELNASQEPKIELISIFKPVAFQIIFGSIIKVVLTVAILTAGFQVSILVPAIAYFPYIFTKKTTSMIIQKYLWAIYLMMIAVTLFK